MGFSISSPWLLLLLLLIPVSIWLQLKYTTRITGARKVTSIMLRSILLLIVISLIAQLTPYYKQEQRNLVLLIDRSDSLGKLSESSAQQFALSLYGDDASQFLSVMSFGKNTMIDRSLSKLEGSLSQVNLQTSIDSTQTNIAAALRQAGGLLQADGGGKIVLFTDGYETRGSLVKEAELLRTMNVTVDIVQLKHQAVNDVAISHLQVPSQLKQGEKYKINVSVASTYETEAELNIYEDNQLIVKQNVSLISGNNSFMLDAVATSTGLKQYRAVVEQTDDSRAENNNAYAISRVDGPAGVLIVEGEPNSSQNIESALAASFIAYRTIAPEELSYELVEYVQYDSIIFNNVSAVRLPQQKMEHISNAVRQYGVGFIMLGGDQSFGLGGYFDTPVEAILPVNMQLSGKKKIPDLQLILVIDQSGSMMGTKIELAKEAAARTVELLRSVDSVGVVAFDSFPTWVVSPTKLTAPDKVITSIMSIQPNGGTDIYPALEQGFQGIDLEEPGRKHMILLTDGMSNNHPGFNSLTENMKQEGVTLSTVAVGQDADSQFLSQLAEKGAGRFYFTADETTLPAIFSRETTLMSRAYIVDERITPLEGYAGSWSQLWSGGIPALEGYIATSAKTTAEVALWSPQEDPVLSRWQVGAGKSVAFTSDVNGRWSSEWINWSQFPNVITEWVKWTYPQYSTNPYELQQSDDGKLKITSHEAGIQSNLAMTIGNGNDSSLEPLVPIGNGEYEVDVHQLEAGVYFTQIGEAPVVESSAGSESTNKQNGAGTNTEESVIVDNGVTVGYVVPYSSEYRLDMDDTRTKEKLEALASLTSGELITLDDADTAYQFPPATVKQSIDWTRSLLIISLVLWLLDIANRRVLVPWQRWWRSMSSVAFQFKRKQAQMDASSQNAESMNRLSRLQQRKQTVNDRSKLVKTDENSRHQQVNYDRVAQSHWQAGVPDNNFSSEGEINQAIASNQGSSNQKLASKQRSMPKGNSRNNDPAINRNEAMSMFSPLPVKEDITKNNQSKDNQSRDNQNKDNQSHNLHHNSTQADSNQTMNRLLAAKNRRK